MFFQIVPGKSPFVLTVAHDGDQRLSGVAWRAQFLRWVEKSFEPRDLGACQCAKGCRQRLEEKGRSPTLLMCELDRGQLDVNRDPDKMPFVPGDIRLEQAYQAFHAAVQAAIQETLEREEWCFLVDVHSFVELPGVDLEIALGTDEGRTCPAAWSSQLCAGFAPFRAGFSPDPLRGISHRARGGYIIRQAAAQFARARSEERFGAIQIEFRRQPFFTDQPEAMGARLADILSAVVLP